jgi:hypothetical protein
MIEEWALSGKSAGMSIKSAYERYEMSIKVGE